jgi:hypothetical protein
MLTNYHKPETKPCNVPVHPLLKYRWDSQLGFSRRATGLFDCRLLLAIDLILGSTLMVRPADTV